MTYVGLFIIFLGIILLCFEFTDKQRKKDLLKIIPSVLLIFGGIFIGIGGNSAIDAPYGNKALVIIGFIFGIIAIILYTISFKILNKNFYKIPTALILILIGLCIYFICNWDVHPKPKSSEGGCYPSKPYYVCKTEKRFDGSTYQDCRCRAYRD